MTTVQQTTKHTEVSKPGDGHNLELDIGPTVFQVGVSQADKAVILHWTGETDISNIIFERFVGFGLQWPPVRSVSCFTFREEVESLV